VTHHRRKERTRLIGGNRKEISLKRETPMWFLRKESQRISHGGRELERGLGAPESILFEKGVRKDARRKRLCPKKKGKGDRGLLSGGRKLSGKGGTAIKGEGGLVGLEDWRGEKKGKFAKGFSV